MDGKSALALRKTIGWRSKLRFRGCVSGICLLVIAVSGCASTRERDPVPENLVEEASVPGVPEIRFWGDAIPADIDERFITMEAQVHSYAQASGRDVFSEPDEYLALSGGGASGAFGAGLLAGWSEAGTRPEFGLVTGVSTGALIAPFAFLGSDYDDELRDLYTTMSTDDLLKTRDFIAILSGDAIADSRGLRKMLAKRITASMMEELAAEHNKGRRLFVGTTNLDAKRPVIWDIGAIAASGDPNALELIRDVLLASASVPGIMPPVYFDVEAGGEIYGEMHVDGGVSTQVFLYPGSLDLRAFNEKLGMRGERQVYVIRNSRLEPVWEAVEPRVHTITFESIDTLIATQGLGDLFRIYLGAQRDEVAYNLAYIPADFTLKPQEFFDSEYMVQLYELGYRTGKDGSAWVDIPPGFEPP